ncbi:MAG: hypothetical protein Tsb0021_13510 [Chlamydiales bacterium]
MKRELQRRLGGSLDQLQSISSRLKEFKSLEEKVSVLKEDFSLKDFPYIQQISKRSLLTYYVMLAFVAMNQGDLLEWMLKDYAHEQEAFDEFLTKIERVDRLYEEIGGIIGYYVTLMQLAHSDASKVDQEQFEYLHPPGFDMTKGSAEVDRYVVEGIKALQEAAEIYPIGGSGDRLNLKEEKNDDPLPAACLPFAGRTLLEGMIRDLQAREYLHFKLFQNQIKVPIVMMTSHAKHNHAHITEICENCHWFGRSKELFFIFVQPSVPVITKEGVWSFTAPFRIKEKPGGHGMLWRLGQESGAFDWLKKQRKTHALIRQINNPIAGTDFGLIAFEGYGFSERKTFGFASCPRIVDTSEGMIVLLRREKEHTFSYSIQNIEYSEFETKGIEDVSESGQSQYSIYPANTNVLFFALDPIESLIKEEPFCGLMVNMKHKTPYYDQGVLREELGGRLESMMQSIAERITIDSPCEEANAIASEVPTFLTYNERNKTISVAKKSYEGDKLIETPEGSFYDLLENNRVLLKEQCAFSVPHKQEPSDYLEKGPHLLFQYHPALGPLYSIISQKLRGGTIERNSELYLELAEADIEELHLDGSLIIEAFNPLGSHDNQEILTYNQHNGKCTLQKVKVINKGIKREAQNRYWAGKFERNESLHIILHGSAEFAAHSVTLEGDLLFEVPDGHLMEVTEVNGQVKSKLKPLKRPSWYWSYSLDPSNRIHLEKFYD